MEEFTQFDRSYKSQFVRLLFIVLFCVIYNVVEALVAIVVVVQFIAMLISGGTLSRLRYVGRSLAVYVREIFEFITYASDHVPYPFGNWPEVPEDEAPATVGDRASASGTDVGNPGKEDGPQGG